MSQPQSTEVWQEPDSPKAGFGVAMTTEQFSTLTGHIDKVLGETERREKAVADSLLQLKQIESVRTYAAVVKDITTSIQTLSQIAGTEATVAQLLDTLSSFNGQFKTLGDSNEDLESRPSIHTQVNS